MAKESWLAQATGAGSFCSGCGTAELSRAVLQHVVNQTGHVTMDIPTLFMWETRDEGTAEGLCSFQDSEGQD